jgi:antitoxin component YwqK of YwqJK toxin-antitoxin module
MRSLPPTRVLARTLLVSSVVFGLNAVLSHTTAFATPSASPAEVAFAPEGNLIEKDGRAKLNGRPFTGVGVEHYPNRQVARRVSFKNGVKEGEARTYSDLGKLTAIGRFHKGLRNGLQEMWFIEGPKQQEDRYVNGILEGVQTKWHLNGTVFREEHFKKGALQGRKVFYPSREVFSNYVNKNGRKYGIDSGELCFETKRDGKN